MFWGQSSESIAHLNESQMKIMVITLELFVILHLTQCFSSMIIRLLEMTIVED